VLVLRTLRMRPARRARRDPDGQRRRPRRALAMETGPSRDSRKRQLRLMRGPTGPSPSPVTDPVAVSFSCGQEMAAVSSTSTSWPR
jgi:hypothetical protein